MRLTHIEVEFGDGALRCFGHMSAYDASDSALEDRDHEKVLVERARQITLHIVDEGWITLDGVERPLAAGTYVISDEGLFRMQRVDGT